MALALFANSRPSPNYCHRFNITPGLRKINRPSHTHIEGTSNDQLIRGPPAYDKHSLWNGRWIRLHFILSFQQDDNEQYPALYEAIVFQHQCQKKGSVLKGRVTPRRSGLMSCRKAIGHMAYILYHNIFFQSLDYDSWKLKKSVLAGDPHSSLPGFTAGVDGRSSLYGDGDPQFISIMKNSIRIQTIAKICSE